MKKRILLYGSYFIMIIMVIITSSTLAKYVNTNSSEVNFQVGSSLYFNYERSNIYRNNQSVSSISNEYVDADGNTKRRIEVMNVAPQDVLTYHFYVSNFNDVTKEYCDIEGQFTTIATALLAMPSKQKIFNVDCMITYRKVPIDGSSATSLFTALTSKLNLYNCADFPNRKEKYEFKVTVIIDDQIENTTNDDYVGATLSIYLFINATSK